MSNPLSPSREQRWVVCAAIMNDAGDIICSARHYDTLMHRQIKQSTGNWDRRKQKIIQGFVDQHGVFLNRVEALTVARKAGQIIYRCGGDEHELYSDNLY